MINNQSGLDPAGHGRLRHIVIFSWWSEVVRDVFTEQLPFKERVFSLFLPLSFKRFDSEIILVLIVESRRQSSMLTWNMPVNSKSFKKGWHAFFFHQKLGQFHKNHQGEAVLGVVGASL